MISSILVVDDDDSIQNVCRRYLEDAGYHVMCAPTGEDALRKLAAHRIDVVLLDVALPDISGFDLAPRIKKISDAEIVFVTVKDTPNDRVTGLRLGAEYLVKPFELDELAIRLSMLEARMAQRETRTSLHALEIDRVERRVRLGGADVPLTTSEFRLLERLARTPGVPVSFRELSEAGWPDDFHKTEVDDVGAVRMQNIMTHISAVRRKLGYRPVRIESRRGIGYTLTVDAPEKKK